MLLKKTFIFNDIPSFKNTFSSEATQCFHEILAICKDSNHCVCMSHTYRPILHNNSKYIDKIRRRMKSLIFFIKKMRRFIK